MVDSCYGPCGVPNYGFPRGNVSCHDRSCPDDRACSNPHSGKNDGASSNKGEFADFYLAGERRSRSDMDTIADGAVVIDGCPCIDDNCFAETCAGAYCAHGQNLAAITYKRILGDEGSWVGYGEGGITTVLEPAHALQSSLSAGTADGYAGAHLGVITIPLFPVRESLFTVKNWNVGER